MFLTMLLSGGAPLSQTPVQRTPIKSVGTAQPPFRTTPARLLSGSISNADYPAAAMRAGARGMVRYAVTLGVDGKVTDCAIVISSGNSDLDATTCALARQRYLFEPARRDGQPIVSRAMQTVHWVLPG